VLTVERWTSREARLLREALLMTQRGFAEHLGIGTSTVTDWERQDSDVQLRKSSQRKLAEALARASSDARERFERALARELRLGLQPALTLGTASASYADRLAPSPQAGEALEPDTPTSPDIATVRMLREADSRLGGGYLYAAVTGYLQHSLAPRLFAEPSGWPDHNPLSPAAAMTEMAGWMAHDTGEHGLATQHFHRALTLADASREYQLSAHVLGSLSHVALHKDQPGDALVFARQGQERLAAAPNAEVESWLLSLQARGHAAVHEHADFEARIKEAERVHGDTSQEDRSPWVCKFDAASLAVEIARAFLRRGHLQTAEKHAIQVMTLRPRERARSRAFAQLIQLKCVIGQGRTDEACVIGRNVLSEATALSSRLILEELQIVGRLLTPYQGDPEVKDFLGLLREHVRQHMWLIPAQSAARAFSSARP